MKKFILLFLISTFLSCENQTEVNSTINQSIDDYWPTQIGNNWKYNATYFPGSEPRTLYNIIDTESINGKQYYKFSPPNDPNPYVQTGPYLYLNKTNGDYFYRVGETQYFNSGVQYGYEEGYEYIILKDYLEVNDTWSGSYSYNQVDFSIPNTTTYNVNYTGQILEKNATEIINNVTYNNIIKVKISNTNVYNSTTSHYIHEFWFAKNIGLVKRIYYASNSSLIYTDNITSYTLN